MFVKFKSYNKIWKLLKNFKIQIISRKVLPPIKNFKLITLRNVCQALGVLDSMPEVIVVDAISDI